MLKPYMSDIYSLHLTEIGCVWTVSRAFVDFHKSGFQKKIEVGQNQKSMNFPSAQYESNCSRELTNCYWREETVPNGLRLGGVAWEC